MNFITGSVKKSGIDKNDSLPGGGNTRPQINCCTALLVHNADLQSVRRDTQDIFYHCKQINSESDFLRAMHFGFNDIDTTLP